MQVRLLCLGIGAVSLLPSCSGMKQKNSDVVIPKKPNVIFLIADDIGYGDLSCYGAKTIQTPNVERVAKSGLLFTDAHSVAATSTPSRYSMFTGCYSWRRDDTGIAAGNAGMVIHPDQPTVADMFRECGYCTGAIGKWHLGLADKTGGQDWNGFITPGPKDIGFDYSYLMAATADRVPCVWVENQRIVNLDPSDPIMVSYKDSFPGEPLGRSHPELLTKLKPSPNHGHDQAIVNGISRIGYMKGGKQALWEDEFIADSITTHAVQYIEEHKDKPFFLYVGTNDVHVPRWPNAKFTGKSGMGPRGDALLQFDWTVGQILDALERTGLRENTLLVLSSDNGPVVDDGYADEAVKLLGDHTPWGPFRGGKYSNFEAGTRIPLVISWPGVVEPGVSNALVSQIDFYASMAKLMDQKMPANGGYDSQDYLNTFLGVDKEGRDYVIEAGGAVSVYDGEWKYIEPNNKSKYNRLTNIELGNDNVDQLYHIGQDIREQKNMSSEKPEILKKLKSILEKEKNKQN